MPRCEYCGRYFKSVQGMTRHIATQHPQAREEVKLVSRKDMKAYVDARISDIEKELKRLREDMEELKKGMRKFSKEVAETVAKLARPRLI